MALTLVQGSSLAAWGSANNGATPANATAVTWFQARTSGNLLLLCVNSDGTYATPTGWTLARSQVNDSALYIFYRIADNTATDTPSLDNNAATCISWAEYSGNDASPLDVVNSAGSSAGATTRATGNVTTTVADELAVAIFGSSSGTAGITWSGHTNSFVEQTDGSTSNSGTDTSLSVAVRDLTATGTYSSTGTCSLSSNGGACIATFKQAAAGGTTRGCPMGPDGNAFNGGRTFQGVIR